MTPDSWDFWFKAIPILISVGAMVVAALGNRRKHVDARFREGSSRMDRHDARLQALEQSVSSLPEREDLHELQLAITRQTGALGRMEAVMEGNSQIMKRLETIVSRHEDHLLSGAKR